MTVVDLLTSDDDSGRKAGIVVDQVRVQYGAIEALAGVSLELSPGEVHGLVGHNGSGKSTLARVLAGNEAPSSGQTFWDGESLVVGAGISVVHQSLGLADELTALDNYGVSSGFDTSRGGWIDWRREIRSFEGHRSVLSVDVTPRMKICDMSPSQRAGVALMRCIRALEEESHASRFVILDEVSSYLDHRGREELARMVASLAASGVGVIFISHYLDEVLSMCSKVSVLRSGTLIGTYDCLGLEKAALSRLMFGEVLEAAVSGVEVKPHTVEGGKAFTLLPFLDVEVRSGEILGITGRSGGAQEELPYALVNHFRRLRRSGGPRVALVPSDRLSRGIWLKGSIAENLTLSSIRDFSGKIPWSFSPRRERKFVTKWLAETNFRVSGPQAQLDQLSGGMQQKVLVGRALHHRPDLLVLHEPTQGIDVNARAGIMTAVRDAANAGAAVILVSNEQDELVALADSVIVYTEGKSTIYLRGNDVSHRNLSIAI
jgi:ribose transport system ATP-binding protein